MRLLPERYFYYQSALSLIKVTGSTMSSNFYSLNANFSHAYIFNRNQKVFSHYRRTNLPYNILIFKEKSQNHIKKPDADRLKTCH
ncbi:hypothetical protein DU258_00265 [Salmonella enterica subsp. enterica]|nr:hypothetical protein [Salmonella enterica subsp. enterica serovar Kambole]EBS2655262.1 hypothetical protein [Salmonella enterica subsp. enterica serovar Kambole]EBY4016910.1 hypothetical protein [Salmonella enterica subsp. enterica serovar Kambole]ECH9425952.1 hypothetical protein [Salmonella enterica subsp. enterica]MKD00965.1 hypothetical protein [Salmonella enterica subsp. enterica serovar Kambole]